MNTRHSEQSEESWFEVSWRSFAVLRMTKKEVFRKVLGVNKT